MEESPDEVGGRLRAVGVGRGDDDGSECRGDEDDAVVRRVSDNVNAGVVPVVVHATALSMESACASSWNSRITARLHMSCGRNSSGGGGTSVVEPVAPVAVAPVPALDEGVDAEVVGVQAAAEVGVGAGAAARRGDEMAVSDATHADARMAVTARSESWHEASSSWCKDKQRGHNATQRSG